MSGRDSYRENYREKLSTEPINKASTEVETEAMAGAGSEAEKGTMLHSKNFELG